MSNYSLVFAEVPLLFETDFYTLFDKNVLIVANRDIVLKRLIERGLSLEEAKNRIFATTDKAKGALLTLAKEEGYETFVAGEDDDKLKRALGEEVDNGIDFSMLKLIRPFDYQQEILERLQVEREVRGHWKNLVVAATGTGKTVTLKVLAESFSDMGVPVFVADIKGDLSGMCQPGSENKHIRRSIDNMGIENFGYVSFPVRFWDVYGEGGIPCRTTISEMGPILLARLLDLTDVQEGVLNIVFHVADDEGLLLLDLHLLSVQSGPVLSGCGDGIPAFNL